jgi:threonine dehydratase
MPVCTPVIKVENTKRHGADVIISGQTLEDAAEFAREQGKAHGMTLIHPYDDRLIIAGQGTIALEMLQAVPSLDTLVIPIGGGGLIAGMAIAAKSLKPEIRVIGVQAQLYPSMYNVLKGQHLTMRGDTLAEGLRVKQPGRTTAEIIHQLVDDIVLVTEEQIEHAIATLISIEETVVEGAGAIGLAAVLAASESLQGRNIGLVLTGGNIDARLIAPILRKPGIRTSGTRTSWHFAGPGPRQ